jgi:hypothetical protein
MAINIYDFNDSAQIMNLRSSNLFGRAKLPPFRRKLQTQNKCGVRFWRNAGASQRRLMAIADSLSVHGVLRAGTAIAH